MLAEGDSIKALAEERPLIMPVLAVGGRGQLAVKTMRQVTAGKVESVQLGGMSHYVALEAPEALAETILKFVKTVDVT